jgi:PAS domain-containing protein
MDEDGNWQYVNETFAKLFDRKRQSFISKNMFEEFPEMRGEWQEIIKTVAITRETYVHRSLKGMANLPLKNKNWAWNILVFPIKLHDERKGVVLSARVIERR